MAFGEKIIPLKGVNTDLHESLMPPDLARFIKNLVYEITDTATAGSAKGSQTGVFKPLQSNSPYIADFQLPPGDNQVIGRFTFREFRQVFVFLYNSRGNHTIYRLNGADQTYNIVYQGPCLNFLLQPEYFIHIAACWLEQTFVTDPVTGEERVRSYLMFTLGINFQYFICVEDSIATQGFNPTLFPYFAGNYNPCELITMGLKSPSDCIEVSEIPLDQSAETKNNRLLFNTWQFRLLYVDVWGRPSEHGIISNMYIPGQGDCIANSSGLPRCLDLVFDAPPPYINSIQVEYRNCNSQQWYLADTLMLYDGSPLGDWWLRPRNPKVAYDSSTGKISYTFCAEGGCDPIAPTETNRLFNPLPRSSQSLFKIGDVIGLGNNEAGFLPFSESLLNEFSVTVTPPDKTTGSPTRTIEILVECYNPFTNFNQPIFPFKIGAQQFYGYGGQGLLIFAPNPASQLQYFSNPNQTGFVGVLAGTGAYAFSEQWMLDTAGNFTKVTDFTHLHSPLTNKVKYFQKFTFTNLKPQTYVFRIISPQSDPLVDPNYTKTSSYLRGSFPFNFTNFTTPVNHSVVVDDAKELIVNVCDGDYSSETQNRILVIFDLTGSTSRAGYVKNTNDPAQDQIGIELLTVGITNPKKVMSLYTDHNGFFFVATQASGHGSIYDIKGYCNCQYVNFTGSIDTGSSGHLTINNYFLNQNTVCPNYALQPCNFILLTGFVYLCGTNIGIPGVGVVLSRGGVTYTDQNGAFTLIAHDDCNGFPPSVVQSLVRHDNLYFLTGSCNFTDCNGNCIAPVAISISKCVTCGPREVTTGTVMVSFQAFKGLLSGGVYPIGVVGWDFLDRPTFVQPLGNFTIPSIYQTQVFAPSTVGIHINPTAMFPSTVTYLTFWIGQETSLQEYITWIVDSVVFIDNTGLENTVAPTQIKIYYASLIEYNKQNNYNTTVNWNFIPSGQTTPATGDRVEFLLNGDGTFFPKAISALVKYDQTGQYFLINYTGDLKNLQANAIIRLVRPKLCTGTEPYFEICFKVPVVNGHAVISDFILNAFDTYYLNRQIPVPTLQVGSSPPTFVNEPRVFGVPFESSSPSDFWGQNCQNIGRVNSKNPYETVIFSPDAIKVSGGLSATGQLNFLNQFDEAEVDFGQTGINGITAVLPETSTVLVIGQSDNFVVGFDDNVVRVNAQGQATAGSIDNSFGKPERKVGSNYGCQLFDKNTIYKMEGIVQFLDVSKAAVIQHNYQNAIPISNNGMEGYIRSKIKAVQQYNLTHGNSRYFTGIINPVNHEYLLTDYVIGSRNFFNALRQFSVTDSETLAWDIFAKAFKGSYSFTPEAYAELEGEINDQQLFSFTSGLPYVHYTSGVPPSYNTFYNQVAERIQEIVVVMDNLKKKKPLALSEYCKQGAYYADRVVTETGQLSRILLAYFLQAEFGWYAPFLCDLQTPPDPNLPQQTGPNVLLDGNMLTGTWIKIRLVGDPAINTVYSEFQGIGLEVFPSEKSGV